jgi:hypothetical protein
MDEEIMDINLYKPGQCNIGPVNRLFRLSYGFFFLTFSYFMWVMIELMHAGVFFKALLFFPLYAGFLGIYQARAKFCVHHAKRRTYDMR